MGFQRPYPHKFSRHDFTLPQPFACLEVKEHQRRSYRGAEELLRDSPGWRRRAGVRKGRSPDHDTLWRAAKFLLQKCRVEGSLDAVARWAAVRRALGRSVKPPALDSTYFESRHVSRHYERRRNETATAGRKASGGGKEGGKAGNRERPREKRRRRRRSGGEAAAHRQPPSEAGGRGGGAQPLDPGGVGRHRHRLGPPALPAAAVGRAAAGAQARFSAAPDAGYDSEPNHEPARGTGVRPLIPASAGRPTKGGRPPEGRHRRRMKKLLGTQRGRKRSGYTQRWQVETANSMIKRNLGSALSGKTAWSRKRDMTLKALTHDVMTLANLQD